jgi:aminoglycoside phosphotransferase (APT) family kinase protein
MDRHEDPSRSQLQLDLGEALAPVLGGPTRIEGLRLLSGGASRATWSFDAHVGSGAAATVHPLVLQRTRGSTSTGMGGPSMAVEDDLLAAAHRRGVPVPRLVLPSARTGPQLSADGASARVCERVEGETLGAKVVRDERFAQARAGLARQCGAALAAIHQIPPAEVPGLRPWEPVSRLRTGLDLLGEARPAFELALRWLEDHRPDSRPAAVAHGDFRIGNLVVGEEGLRSVLDWELAHVGDPVEDLGWLCVRSWRFGGDGLVGGVGDLSDLLEGYRDAGGAAVEESEVLWWIVSGTLTWGLICAVQARRHLDGHVRSVELATVGRRICETEYDLLQLLGVPTADPAALATPGSAGEEDALPAREALHGRPTATELVDAVRDHLVEKVAPQLEGSAGFHLKVAANALGIVARELREAPAMERALARRLAAVGVADEEALAAAIRDGRAQDQPEVAAAVRGIVVDRLRVANPRWLQGDDRPPADPRPGAPA